MKRIKRSKDLKIGKKYLVIWNDGDKSIEKCAKIVGRQGEFKTMKSVVLVSKDMSLRRGFYGPINLRGARVYEATKKEILAEIL